jgi:ubiquinone/menaquinone biosynthesis C-methylase UbiE
MQLSELQSALRAHPGVRDVAVVSQEVISGEKKLIAYVVPETNYWELVLSGPEEERRRIQKWRKTFDLMQFGKEAASSAMAFDIAGWNSSYTRQPIPAEEMREWIEATVTEILAHRPQQVLEIGCGTGLLLLRIARHCQRYVGADQSKAALERLKEQLAQSTESSAPTALLERSADNFEGFSANSFDTVILNSVVQYFPSVTYLVRVMEQIVELTKPGGKIFVGDVRSLPLLEIYASSVELYQAPPSLNLAELRERVLRRLQQQEELLLSPSFFLALQQRFPKISRVEVKPKRGRFDNELTRFRFNAVLSVGAPAEQSIEPSWLDWSELQLTMDSVKEALEKPECENLALKNIPNARLQNDVAFMKEIHRSDLSRTVADVKKSVVQTAAQGVHLEAICSMASDLGFSLDWSWTSMQPDGRFDAFFQRIPREETAREPVVSWPKPATVSDNFAHHSNIPGQTNLRGKLIQELFEFIKQNLLAENTAADVVLVDAIPPMPTGEPNLHAWSMANIRRT